MVGGDTVITPDGTDRAGSPPRRRRPAVLVGIAALVTFAGLVLIGTLTAPDPAAVEETTTTTVEDVEPPIDPENFTVSQIATGDPLDWGLAMAIDDGYPLDLLEHEDDLYLFTGPEKLAGPGPAGLVAWRSSNGTNWEPLGEGISTDHRITTVDSTVQGLVATAIRREDGALMIWESADAIEWTGSVIPTGSEGPYHIDVASAVGASETALVVASNPRYDRERLLEDRLSELGIEMDLSSLRWELQWIGEGGHHLIVRAPLGIPILQQPVEGLDLTEAQRTELLSELYDPLGTDIWLRRGDDAWQTTEIRDARNIDSIITTPAGRQIAYGSGPSGRLAKATDNGSDWTGLETGIGPWLIERWREGYVGAASPPDLMMSEDGESWRAAGLADSFPDEVGWAPIALGAGDGGMAMFVRGSWPISPSQPAETSELTAVDGTTYVLATAGSGYRLVSRDGRHRWSFDSNAPLQVPDWMDVDLTERTLTFLNTQSGAPIATFTFTEIDRAHQESLLSSPLYQLLGALVFGKDGEEWVIQDMDPQIGERAAIWLLEVTADRVVAVVRSGFDSIDGLDPGLEIWSAPIP